MYSACWSAKVPSRRGAQRRAEGRDEGADAVVADFEGDARDRLAGAEAFQGGEQAGLAPPLAEGQPRLGAEAADQAAAGQAEVR